MQGVKSNKTIRRLGVLVLLVACLAILYALHATGTRSFLAGMAGGILLVLGIAALFGKREAGGPNPPHEVIP
ncbi:MAG TPA: hypothetical protein VJN93_02810 [Candidatus Acidoferrum sp.]|nr:hypothetical protein [Candidatus Acidoferrum sp.]